MRIIVKGLKSSYEPEHLARVFYPSARISTEKLCKDDIIFVRLGTISTLAAVRIGGVLHYTRTCIKDAQDKQFALAQQLYRLLSSVTGIVPKWGLLTGVRPVRLVHDLHASGLSSDEIIARLHNECFVNKDKIDLSLDIAQRQIPIIAQSADNSYSLYISIPFCPSRCSYCSFVSTSISGAAKLIEPYVDKLCLEIKDTADMAKQNKLKLETIYIGGGTPTAVSAQQLRRILAAVKASFDIANVCEYTVEAGRPDCTTREKLDIIKEYGATRISINPQTMCDSVLAAIGRKHTAEDIIRCYDDARKAGHDNINMDIIAGLPTDTVNGFGYSLDKVISLAPENITVHTLTLKRASNIVIKHTDTQYADVEQMLNYTKKLANYDYKPYYMYRQKNTLQSLENTGFSKAGYECLYNVYIMEEIHSILAVGAGGSTKLCGHNGRIERIFNYKYPTEYVNQFDKLLEKKKGVNDFYAGNMDT
ncbi:MAG: coproporphyrinogen dehydrogenase HemZ [Oscillospiraceae bacterium]